MFQLSPKHLKFLMIICALTGCFGFSATAQISEKTVNEVEVPALRKFGSKNSGCFTQNHVVDEAMFKRLIADSNIKKDCVEMYKSLGVDFAKQTLISYRAGGDCFLRVTARVFRNDKRKTYTVRIRNRWGGCRAGGSFHGWLVIEKIPSTYKVEFSETQVTGIGDEAIDEKTFDLNSQLPRKNKPASETVETRSIELKDCIQTIYTKRFVIRDEKAFLEAIRNDVNRDRCLNNLEKIDFGKQTLLGIEINSGYCGIPLGLAYQTFRDEQKKQYLLSVSYLDPGYETCRALMPYDLWVLFPKIPDNYKVGFEVTANNSK